MSPELTFEQAPESTTKAGLFNRLKRAALFLIVVLCWMGLRHETPANAEEDRPSRSTGSKQSLDDAESKPKESTEAAGSKFSLADPSRWRFHGTNTFPHDQLRNALSSQIVVILASRSTIPPETLAKVLSIQLAHGFRAVGFPHAEVTTQVNLDENFLEITVHEGTRYRQGSIEIRGTVNLDQELLSKSLKEKQAPADAVPVFQGSRDSDDGFFKWVKRDGGVVTKTDAIWNPGKPAPFSPTTWKAWDAQIDLILKRMGYSEATFRTSVEPRGDGTAALVIDFRDEGQRTALGEIRVVGNERNSTESILKYLKLESGMPFDAMKQAHIDWRLRQASRFLKHNVELTHSPLGDGPSHLTIHLVEVPDAPTLDEPFTEIQMAMQRAAKWICSQAEYDCEVVLRSNGLDIDSSPVPIPVGDREASVRLILSRTNRAAMMECEIRERNGDLAWGQVLSCKDEKLLLLSPNRRSKLEGRFSGTLVIQTVIDVRPADEQGRMSWMNFGAGINSKTAADGMPIRDEVSVAPLSFVLETLREGTSCEIEGNVLSVRTASSELTVDVETGRIIKWNYTYKGGEASIRFGKNLYAEADQKWEEHRNSSLNVLKPQRILTGILSHLAAEARELEGLQSGLLPGWFPLAEGLIRSELLKPIDDAIAAIPGESTQDDRFFIPIDINPNISSSPMAWALPMIQGALPHYAKVFPYGTPGWSIGRELTLLLARPKGLDLGTPMAVCQMLRDEQAGPLHFLLAAELFQFVSPWHQITFAAHGLDKMTLEDFEQDVSILLNQKGILREVFVSLVDLVHSMDESSIQNVIKAMDLDDANKKKLLRIANRISRRSTEEIDAIIPEIVESLWSVLEPVIGGELKRLATPPAMAKQPRQTAGVPD